MHCYNNLLLQQLAGKCWNMEYYKHCSKTVLYQMMAVHHTFSKQCYGYSSASTSPNYISYADKNTLCSTDLILQFSTAHKCSFYTSSAAFCYPSGLILLSSSAQNLVLSIVTLLKTIFKISILFILICRIYFFFFYYLQCCIAVFNTSSQKTFWELLQMDCIDSEQECTEDW